MDEYFFNNMSCFINELNNYQGFFALISLLFQIPILTWIILYFKKGPIQLDLAMLFSTKYPLGKQVVVTEVLKTKIAKNGKGIIVASWPSLLNFDFAIGERKKLRLRFIVNGKLQRPVDIDEDETYEIDLYNQYKNLFSNLGRIKLLIRSKLHLLVV